MTLRFEQRVGVQSSEPCFEWRNDVATSWHGAAVLLDVKLDEEVGDAGAVDQIMQLLGEPTLLDGTAPVLHSTATSCEHMFDAYLAGHTRMTSQGSAYSRFKRALAGGNPLLIRSTAAELPRIELADALAICLALADADDDAYGRAAARFTARWSLELPAVTLEEMQALGAALLALRAPETAPTGRRLLAALARARDLERMGRALDEHEPPHR